MKIEIKDLQQYISRGPALVVGPGMTTSSARESELLRLLRARHPLAKGAQEFETYLDYSDALIASDGVTEAALRGEIEGFFLDSGVCNPQLGAIVKAYWTAVVSLSSDDHMRTKLADFLYSKPTKWSLTTVSVPGETPSLTTVPYYSLLGDIRDKREISRLAITQSNYLQRTRIWSEMLNSIPDIVKSDPLIFLGTNNIVKRVCDFMNEFLRLAPRIPKQLIFLADDHTATNPVFQNLVRGVCEIQTVQCELRDIGDILSRESLSVYKLPLFADASKRSIDFKALAGIEDQVGYVPRREEMIVNPDERNRLLDSLFRPTHLDWSPYSLGMELKRDVSDTIAENIRDVFRKGSDEIKILRLHGEAGVGKTVALRSVAFALAQEDYLCLWIKKSYGELSDGRFEAVARSVAKAVSNIKTPVVFFLDDPWGSRVWPREVTESLQAAPFEWALVLCTRNSDMALTGGEELPPLETPPRIIEIPADFSTGELGRLPEYLLSLHVAQDLEKAKAMMRPPGIKHSKDVLCSLWYLLPQTQASIEESLVGEYQRLGEVEKTVAVFARVAGASKGIAKSAYEFVTATSGFDNAALPVEVLVSALGISYAEWQDMCAEKKPLWGLLYDEHYPSAETYAYRTRNTVVTEVLLRALNRGTTGHTGEFRCLRDLIRSCRSSTAPYKTFLKDILVDRRRLIEQRFNYEQAVELYDAAEWAYPKEYPLLEHHKCLVQRRLGGDTRKIYDQLKKLIVKSHDRSIPDQDSAGNLNTSAAATLNQMIKDQQVEPADGANAAFEHITAALQHDQFSLHAHHVHAELLMKIAAALRTEDRAAFMANLERAARIVDRALLLMPPTGPKTAEQATSLDLFKKLRAEIMTGFSDFAQARSAAIQLFKNSGDQTGLAFIARIILGRAIETKKGGAFKKVDEFLREAFKVIADAGASPGDEITLCRIELVIHWNILADHGPVFWEGFIDDLWRLQHNPRFRDDSLYIFFAAVAHFNVRHFPEAEERFQLLRTNRHRTGVHREIRCHFLGDKAEPKIFEGKISRSASDKRFVFCVELGTDIPVRRGHLSRRDEEQKHFKVAFSMLGPLAVDR